MLCGLGGLGPGMRAWARNRVGHGVVYAVGCNESWLIIELVDVGCDRGTTHEVYTMKRYSRIVPALLTAVVGLVLSMPAYGQDMSSGQEMSMPSTSGSLKVVSPKNGQKITTTDIPVRVKVSDFKLSPKNVGLPDAEGEGHIHVMLDGMNMGVLFNMYTAPKFTLPGQAITPGRHTLIFTLASNTHMDFGNTVQKVDVDYRPAKPKPAPKPTTSDAAPAVKIVSPADGAKVGPKFTVRVKPTNFTPSLDLQGKPNLKGYGHYHVMVMAPSSGQGEMGMDMNHGKTEMMSMAGMVGMPGSNSFPVDLSAWKNGEYMLTIVPAQNDHTPVPGAIPATISINLTGAAAS